MKRSALALSLLLVACGGGRVGAGLVEVREVTPRHAEVGEFFRVSGSGFPEGRPARVILRGNLYRAGEPVQADVEIETEGRLTAPHALDVAVTAALATRFCGGVTDGRHTTFRGDLEVAFAPRSSHGSTVSGRLDGVVLDMTPERPAPSTSAALGREGERFARFLGVRVAPSEQGLALDAVEPKSRAARAGLVAGDIVLEVEGMVVREAGDFVPPPNTRAAELVIQRDVERRPVRVESVGFRGSSPRVLAPAVLLIGLFVAIFLAFRSPLGRALGFLGRRAGEALRGSARPGTAREPAPWERFARGITRQLPESFAPYLALIVQTALVTCLAFGKTLVAAELDLFVLFAGGASGLCLAALATGGGRRPWSLGRALGAAFGVLALELSLLFALLTVAVALGGLRATDVINAQGVWPWQWHAFTSPLLAGAALLALLSRVPAARTAPRLSSGGRPASRTERLLDLAEWAHGLMMAAVLSIAFFGGSRHPLESAEAWGTALGALMLLIKSWAIVGGIALFRTTLGRIDAGQIRGAAFGWLVVPSALCLALAVLARHVLGGAALSTLESRVGPVLFAVVLVVGVWLVRRALRGLRDPSSELGIQPWL